MMEEQNNNIYFQKAMEMVPLILSLEDRNPSSRTYGCFDRNYWGWKFTDFPGSRFQEGVCALGLLYSSKFPGNYLYRDERVLRWIFAGMAYWADLAHKNGSFDEAYPYEQSLAATAFTAFYISEAFFAVKDKIPDALKSTMLDVFHRAGGWLCRNEEKHGVLSNHTASAAAALYNIYLITGQEKFRLRCDHFLRVIYARQSGEGWFEEYGGADPGYQTLGSFFLAKLWQRTKDPVLLEKLKSSAEFLAYFIHPDHAIGGEYASRNTEFYFPAAFEMLAEVCPAAGAIAGFMREGIESGNTAGVRTVDAYNLFPMMNNYIFAGLNTSPSKETLPELPFMKQFHKHFKDAGILVESRAKYYAVLGISKGGVIKVYDKAGQKLSYSDCGYWARAKSGKVFSSQNLDRSRQASIEGDKVHFKSSFSRAAKKVFSPVLFIVFRIFMLTFGRAPAFSLWLKCLIVKALVTGKENTPCVLSREIIFADDRISVKDTITGLESISPAVLARGDKFTAVHMGSAHYFQKGELTAEFVEGENLLERAADKNIFVSEKDVKF